MLIWLRSNLSTILMLIAILASGISILHFLIRQKRQGKHLCGGSSGGTCSGCSGCGCPCGGQ